MILGGPMAKTLHSQHRGPGFNPWSRKEIPHASTNTWCGLINTYINKYIIKYQDATNVCACMFSKKQVVIHTKVRSNFL